MVEAPTEVRRFSKEQQAEARQATAASIREKRQEHFEQQRSLQEQIGDLTVRLETKRTQSAQVTDEVRSIQGELDRKQGSAVRRTLEFYRISQLKKELGIKQAAATAAETESLELQDTLGDLNHIGQDRSSLEAAKVQLAEFYSGQSESWNQYEAEEKACAVSEISRERGVTFIHALHPNYETKGLTPLREGVDWQTKFKIAAGLEPDLSASTVSPDKFDRSMWGRMGVVLTEGSVQDASSRDLESTVTGLQGRKSGERFNVEGKRPPDIANRINRAIKKVDDSGRPDDFGYNEFIVRNPKIGGFYYCEQEQAAVQRTTGTDLVPPAELFALADQYRLPVYYVEDGKFYQAELDQGTGRINRGAEMTPEQMKAARSGLSELAKSEMQKEIFSDSAFKFESPEAHNLRSRDKGRGMYIELTANLKDSSLIQPKEADEEGLTEKGLTEIKTFDTIERYFRSDGDVWLKREPRRADDKTPWKRATINISERARSDELSRYVELGTGNTGRLERPIHTMADYLSSMSGVIEKFSHELGGAQNNEIYRTFLENARNQAIYHVYGFAEQAEKMGDRETAGRAYTLVDRYQTHSEITEHINRRTDSEGRLKMTREDIA